MFRRVISSGLLMVILLTSAGCAILGGRTAAPSSCDGISADLGGCDADRPVYSGQTCEAVGTEFGSQFNSRALEIIKGPADRDGMSRAVRMTHLMVVASALANKHLRDHGMIAKCGVDEFMSAAEAQFSAELRSQAGRFLDDGSKPHSYAEWRTELLRFVGVIDQDEGSPY